MWKHTTAMKCYTYNSRTRSTEQHLKPAKLVINLLEETIIAKEGRSMNFCTQSYQCFLNNGAGMKASILMEQVWRLVFIICVVNLLGLVISSIVSTIFTSSIVAAPISTRPVAAMSNKQKLSSPHISLASFSSVALVNVALNIGEKLGK